MGLVVGTSSGAGRVVTSGLPQPQPASAPPKSIHHAFVRIRAPSGVSVAGWPLPLPDGSWRHAPPAITKNEYERLVSLVVTQLSGFHPETLAPELMAGVERERAVRLNAKEGQIGR